MSKVARRYSFSKISGHERGQATLEYVLLLTMAAMLGVGFHASFGKLLNNGVLNINAVLEQELTSGDWDGTFPEAAKGWEN